MSTCRRIISPSEFSEIRAAGTGYVLSPFGRVIHAASCAAVERMAPNPDEPKWFAPDPDAAREYQRRRLETRADAQPFRIARCCESLIDTDTIVTRSGIPASRAADRVAQSRSAAVENRPTGSSGTSSWVCRPVAGRRTVELWTTRRTPFSTDQSVEQQAMIRQLQPHLRRLVCGPDERLHGVFTSDETESRQPDAENITFYNFGQHPFVGAGRSVGFERSYLPAPPPPAPLSPAPRYHHAWSVVRADAPLLRWRALDSIAEWNEVPIDLKGDLGLSAWRAIREHPAKVIVHRAVEPNEPFAIIVRLSTSTRPLPSVVTALKALVDGPLGGLQRADGLPEAVVRKLVSRRWARPIDKVRLLELVSSEELPAILPRPPFNANGLDPCDELCVAGIARIDDVDTGSFLTGAVVKVTPN
jgi:hypothetical protein